MKRYIKRTALYLVYNELAFFVGGLAGGAAALALHLILGNGVNRNLLYGIVGILADGTVAFLLMQRETYEERHFSLKESLCSVLSVFAFRWLVVLLRGGDTGFLLCGSASTLWSAFFPLRDSIGTLMITLIAVDLLCLLPAFLIGGWWGLRRRKRETEALTQQQV
ncbi:MAG: hypothetical protein IJN04_00215 [Clostridia bacterium]|nr:hypothetical protein [Clostridia bacterium]